MKTGFVTSITLLLALPRGLVGGTVDKITVSKVIIDPGDFKLDWLLSAILPEVKTLIECSSLSLLKPNDTKLFCKTSEGECLISNASYPANYDDESGGGGYRCYTTEKLLIDIPATLQPWNNASFYCPPPFEMIVGVGCIFGQVGPIRSFEGSQQYCQSNWPTSTLLSSPPDHVALASYVLRKIMALPWVGVTRQSDGRFYWLDGTETQASEWPQGGPNGDGDCALVYIPIGGSSTILKVASCSMGHYFVCQVKE